MKQNIEISAIHLVRIGDNVVVKIEYNNNWFEVISEYHDGAFSHIVEYSGMIGCINMHSKKIKVEEIE